MKRRPSKRAAFADLINENECLEESLILARVEVELLRRGISEHRDIGALSPRDERLYELLDNPSRP